MTTVQSDPAIEPERHRSQHFVSSDSAGWVTRSDSYPLLNGQEPLAAHMDWAGPHKLVGRGQGHVCISEVFVDRHAERDILCSEEGPDEYDQLIECLVQGPLAANPELPLDNWQPPQAADLSNHLRTSGHEPAVDDQGNLRLTLKNRGSDGQVRVDRAPGRLRLTMPMGQWDGLDELRERAMLQLARRHNDRVRLVRIAWDADGSSRRCTAQVDFSGLPCELAHTWLWTSNLLMAIRGLELTLHQMGKELDVLADPRNKTVAAWLVGQHPRYTDSFTRPGKPR